MQHRPMSVQQAVLNMTKQNTHEMCCQSSKACSDLHACLQLLRAPFDASLARTPTFTLGLNPVVQDAPAPSCRSVADIKKMQKRMSTVAGEEDEELDYSAATRAHLGMPGKHADLMSEGSRVAGTCQLMTHHVIMAPSNCLCCAAVMTTHCTTQK